jgi:hypothetical protein
MALDTVNFTDYPKGKAKSGKIDAGREIVNFPTENSWQSGKRRDDLMRTLRGISILTINSRGNESE